MRLKHYCCAICNHEFNASEPPLTCRVCEHPFLEWGEVAIPAAPKALHTSAWTEAEWSATMRRALQHERECPPLNPNSPLPLTSRDIEELAARHALMAEHFNAIKELNAGRRTP